MSCIDCKHMACKVYYAKTEIWHGFCLNHLLPKFRTNIKGYEHCEKEEREQEC